MAPVSPPPPPTEHGTVPVRYATLRSLRASWPPPPPPSEPPPFPPSASLARHCRRCRTPLRHSARPGQSQEREREQAACRLPAGAREPPPLRSLHSLHASVAAVTAALPLLKLLLLHTVNSLPLPIHRYRRPQSARPSVRPFIDRHSLPLRCDLRSTDEAGPPFPPSFPTSLTKRRRFRPCSVV